MTRKPIDNSSLVYSTEHGRMCPGCGMPQAKCTCGKQQTAMKGDGTVRVAFETKGRKGKGVTMITGIPGSPDDLKDIAKKLKQQCGSGGTITNGTIEIQGDHRNSIVEELAGRGYRVKRSGD